MTAIKEIPSVDELKTQARRLRSELSGAGTELSHSQSLELLARQHGFRDWNTLRARAGNGLRLGVGDRVRGTYLGQDFAGEVRAVSMLGDGARRRVTLHFDAPVDVVRFDSFSAYRQRVTGVIGWDGRSLAKTSDGQPQLIVRPAAA